MINLNTNTVLLYLLFFNIILLLLRAVTIALTILAIAKDIVKIKKTKYRNWGVHLLKQFHLR